MSARITRPAKTAMQSGRAKIHQWVLNFEPSDAQRADTLMGWGGSRDTRGQITLTFQSQQEAEAYCRKHAIAYVVAEPHASTVKPKSYAENFRPDRLR
ncbi:MAG TPA: ETC complex I subunit [Alphaproteobacteria bacterium]